jgi:hypothetical protein
MSMTDTVSETAADIIFPESIATLVLGMVEVGREGLSFKNTTRGLKRSESMARLDIVLDPTQCANRGIRNITYNNDSVSLTIQVNFKYVSSW